MIEASLVFANDIGRNVVNSRVSELIEFHKISHHVAKNTILIDYLLHYDYKQESTTDSFAPRYLPSQTCRQYWMVVRRDI